MKISGSRRLLKEDFRSEDQELVGRIGFALNPLLEQLYLIFNKRITIGDNLDQEFREVTLEVDQLGAPINQILLKSPISKINAIQVADYKIASASQAIAISSIAAGDSSIVTTAQPHGFTSGQYVTLGSTNSTPNINGSFKIVVKNDTMFEVPKLTTVSGSAGNVVSLDSSIMSFPFVTFRQDGSTTRILQITGLNPNTKYRLKFWIIGQ
jgi:hypothetical protein